MSISRYNRNIKINPYSQLLELQVIDWRAYDYKAPMEEEEEDEYGDSGYCSDDEPKYNTNEKKYIIEIFGFDKNNNSVCLTVNDFTPYFFVEMPPTLKPIHINRIVDRVKSKVDSWVKGDLVSWKVVKRMKFYGFTNEKKYNFLRMVFKTKSAFYSFKRQFDENILIKGFDNPLSFKGKVYETNIDPMLRFMHLRDIEPAAWICVPKGEYTLNTPKRSKCNIDVSCNWRKVFKSPNETIGPMRILSFDIECTSVDGSFPKPERKGDQIIQIGSTCHEYGSTECHFRHIVTLGDCDPVEGTKVECYKTEKELIAGWARFIEQYDPDVITGYNIFGFDWEYIYTRAKLGMGNKGNDYTEYILNRLSRSKDKPAIYVEKNLSSSALGDNFLRYVDCPGRIPIDVFKLAQRDFKLESYKLDFVAAKFLNHRKIDLKPHQIFEKYTSGTPKEIGEIATYCVRDCELCNRLIIKLETIAGSIAMANVCTVPLSYLFLRGQGVKLFSLVAKQCQKEGYVIKVVEKPTEQTGYEGAIVFTPKPQICMDPITVLDYGSLYPSSMISENLSHDTLVEDPIYLNLPGYNYNKITYDIFQGVGDEKKKVGEKTSIFAEKENGEKGILPRILTNLLDARKSTRAKIPHQTVTLKSGQKYTGFYKELNDDEAQITTEKKEIIKFKKEQIDVIEDTYNDFQKALLDGRQLALKVTANSLYGQTGAGTSPIFNLDIAAATTATGRGLVILARDKITEKFPGTQSVYGDSVTGDTPLLLLNTKANKVEIKTIETLSNDWKQYEEFKPWETNRTEKQQSKTDYQVWSNGKWTDIVRVIRHKTNKKIYRVNTHGGCVDVTEDHSLLDKDCNKIKPKDCKVGEELLSSFPKFNKIDVYEHYHIMERIYKIEDISKEEMEAYIFGFFYGDGSCGYYPNCDKYSWALNNADKKLLEKCLSYLEDIENEIGFKILDTMKSSGVYKLVSKGSIKYMVNKYRDIFYDKDKYKIIPDKILNGNDDIKKQFLVGYYAADGSKCTNEKGKCIRFDNKGKIGTAQLYYLMESLGYKCSINTRKDKPHIYRVTCTVNPQRKKIGIIKKLDFLRNTEEGEFVYDLETEEGIFNAGIGKIVVKNTDSVFLNFVPHIESKYGNDISDQMKLEKSFELGLEAEKFMGTLLKKPHKCEYEKIFYPFIIFSKKRYVGNKYEFDMKKYKMTSMGVALKRRDYAPIVKEIYGGVISRILDDRDQMAAKEFFKNKVVELLEGKADMKTLIISKSLSGSYANPTQIAHKVLADRIGERDPGNKPQSNDRIPFCYIDFNELPCDLCGEKKLNRNDCKCRKCMKLFCPYHLKNHKSQCVEICRFCRATKDKAVIKQCKTCQGWYCPEDLHKHTKRTCTKTKQVFYDKCKNILSTKLLQGDIIEHPEYIQENDIKIDYRYYLDHQIKVPCLQIFELMMVDPESLIRSAIRRDDNEKSGAQEITKWFTIQK